ncbi:hypothetical protein DLAC_11356 [Tieghemostelium lacteum]|uniref:SET domain-containing protein n=1 Tax=Tieghemostelium lacteum TaxID=361077 RepID=A0A151Z493_TIELA|nr:hypothetical protein DLAC_11356 [Tieghemostelium lacteum]|eukprot:KYQ88614.1 hypothetical protein DLAC_11356 [Tieghemostelium lacteum]
MIEWSKNKSIKWNEKLIVHSFPEGRGVIANEDILENEILVSVPLQWLIHSKCKFSHDNIHITNNNTPRIVNLNTIIDNLDSKQRISFHLIFERLLGSNSNWFEYLEHVPSEYFTTSMFTDEEIQSMVYPIFINEAKKLKNEMMDSYKRYCIVLEKYFNLNEEMHINGVNNWSCNVKLLMDLDLFKWSCGVIKTRSYYYDRNLVTQQNSQKRLQSTTNVVEDKDDCTIVPLADLFNHSSSVDTEAKFNDRMNCYQVRTKTSFKKGDQVLISYGKHSNFTLLNFYGFVVENNSLDSITLDPKEAIPEYLFTETISNSLQLKRKYEILSQYGLSLTNGKFEVINDSQQPFTWNYLTTLRVLLLTPKELDKKKETMIFYNDESPSIENDKLLSNLLRPIIENHLSLLVDNTTPPIKKRFEIDYLLKSTKEIWEKCLNYINNL